MRIKGHGRSAAPSFLSHFFCLTGIRRNVFNYRSRIRTSDKLNEKYQKGGK